VRQDEGHKVYLFPEGCALHYSATSTAQRPEQFRVQVPASAELEPVGARVTLPAGAEQLVPGSSWGTFTIACTIPIAVFVGWYMYRFRKGRVVEASVIGGLAVV